MTEDIGQRGLCPLFGTLEMGHYICDQALAIRGGGAHWSLAKTKIQPYFGEGWGLFVRNIKI